MAWKTCRCQHEYKNSAVSCRKIAQIKISRDPGFEIVGDRKVSCTYADLYYCQDHCGQALFEQRVLYKAEFNPSGWQEEIRNGSIHSRVYEKSK